MATGKIIGKSVQYRVDGPLAVGAFSTVHRCTELPTGRSYAMKIIDKKVATENHMKEALIREINALEIASNSPYVTKLVDKMVSKHNYYLVMELAEGGTLLDLIREQRQELKVLQASLSCRSDASESLRAAMLPVMQYDRVQHFFKQLLLALSSLHDHDIVHRDVKPENILFNKRRTRLMLSDFGFACHAPPGVMLHRACGSLRYCAPELLRENPRYDGRKVDVWAAGVTLYVMLFGGHPFRCPSQDPDSLLEVITTTRYRIPRTIPAEIEDMLQHMLCVDPVERWSVKQLLQHRWMAALGSNLRSASLRSLSSTAVLPPSSPHDSAEAVVELRAEDCPPIDAIPSDDEIIDDGFYQSSTDGRLSSNASSSPLRSGTSTHVSTFSVQASLNDRNAGTVELKENKHAPANTAVSITSLGSNATESPASVAYTKRELLQEGSMSTSMVSIESSTDSDNGCEEAHMHSNERGDAAHINGVAKDAYMAQTNDLRRFSSDASNGVSTSSSFSRDDQVSSRWVRYFYGLHLTARILARFVAFVALCVATIAVRVILKRDLVDLPMPEVVRNYLIFLLSTPLRRSHLMVHEQLLPSSSAHPVAGFTSSLSSHSTHEEYGTFSETDSHLNRRTRVPQIPGSGLRHYVRTVDQLLRDSFVGSTVLDHNTSLTDIQTPFLRPSKEPLDASITSSPAPPSLATIAPALPSPAPSLTMAEEKWPSSHSVDLYSNSMKDAQNDGQCNGKAKQTAGSATTNSRENNTTAQTERTTILSTHAFSLALPTATVPLTNPGGAHATTSGKQRLESGEKHGTCYDSQVNAAGTADSEGNEEEQKSTKSDNCQYTQSPIAPLTRAFPGHRQHSENFPLVSSETAAR